jgi:exodeoxyribonuclease-5
MDWSPQQSHALTEVGQWLKNGPQVFKLFGYAGTGKTTLAKHLAGLQDGEVLFGAYTGKAASVLSRKGCPASTLHSLLYRLNPMDEKKLKELQQQLTLPGIDMGKVKEEIKKASQPTFGMNEQSPLKYADLLIVDEVSMVNDQLGTDLLSFGKKVLVLGDPGQLPPVEGTGFFTKDEPDFVLTEIHRQAAGSPVINMATQARQGRRLTVGYYGDSKVVARDKLIPEDMLAADQILTGLNKTRKNLLAWWRDRHNWNGLPQVGEKIICLRNNHQQGLLNGTQWTVRECEDKGTHLRLGILPDDEVEDDIKYVDAHHFDVDLSTYMPWQRRALNEFDYGYAITCHKAQGSQWPHVFVKNESYAFREDSARWLYTALTRAENCVTVVL